MNNSNKNQLGIKDVHVRYWVDKNAEGKEVFGATLNVQLSDGRIREIPVEDTQPIDTWPRTAADPVEVVRKMADPDPKVNTDTDGHHGEKKLWGLPAEVVKDTPPTS